MAEVPELSSLPDKKQVAVFEALRKMQAEHDRIIAEMNEAKRQLAVRARALVEPLWDARMALISGAASTADAEGAALAAKSSSLSGFTFQPEAEGEKAAAKSEEGEASESAAASASGDGSSGDAVTARFTEFWTQVLVNDPIWADMIESRDMPALEFLIDCRVSTHADWKGFTLEWTFADNPYFTNKVLSKQVRFTSKIGGPEELGVKLVKGCEIDWKEGQRLTGQTVKPKRKGGRKARGKKGGRPAEESPVPSVFDFFERTLDPEKVSKMELGMDALSEVQEQVNMDIQAVDVIREELAPRAATLLFEGDGDDDDDDDEEGGAVFMHDEEDEEDDDDGSGDGGVDTGALQAALADAFGGSGSSTGETGSGNPFAAADGSNPFAAADGSNPFAAQSGGEGAVTGEGAATGEGGDAQEKCEQQ